MSPRGLLLVVALAGGATMVVELGAVRLLAPWFGASSSVWTNVIGVVLAALAVGYTVGARLATGPRPLARLSVVLMVGAALAATLPGLTPWVAGAFMPDGVALAGASRLLVWGSLAAALVLFLPIAACLGCACPLAVESLQRQRGGAAGHAGGHVLAASTLGSLAGTFGTTHLFVPVLGTAWTFLLAGLVLMCCGLFVRWAARSLERAEGHGGDAARGLLVLALGTFGVGASLSATSTSTRSGGGAEERVLARAESAYQSLRVTELGAGPQRLRKLQVNESLDSFQSVWSPELGLLPPGFYYNHFALPYGWATREQGATPETWDVMIVGLGAGSAVRVLEGVLGPATQLAVTGVELDPRVVELAVEYFELETTTPDRVVVGGLDGRAALALDAKVYDQVIMDAYANNMEIPPHLASVEAFALAHARLREGGWLTVNVGGFGVEDPVVQGIAGAVAAAFQSEVSVARVPFARNLTLHARKGGDVPQPGTRAFGSLGAPLVGGLGVLLPTLQLDGAWRVVEPVDPASVLRDQRSNMEALQARSIATAEGRLQALDGRGTLRVRRVAATPSEADLDLMAASRELAAAGDLAGAAQAAKEVQDPVAGAALTAYLTWAAGDPQAAIEEVERSMAEAGADSELLSLVVDLALVVGADGLARARLVDLEAAAGFEAPSPELATQIASRRSAVEVATLRRARAAGALTRARGTVAAVALMIVGSLLGLWMRLRRAGAPGAGLPSPHRVAV